MTVDPATAAGSFALNGETYYFCSSGCLKKFIAEAEHQVPESSPVQIQMAHEGHCTRDHGDSHSEHDTTVTDPVCKMKVDPATAAAEHEYNGTKYYFCAVRCKERFAADPESFLSPTAPAAA